MTRAVLLCCLAASLLAAAAAQAQAPLSGATLTSSEAPEETQRAQFGLSQYIFPLGATGTPAVSNNGGTIIPNSVGQNPLLATIPGPGVSFNLGVLGGCSILLPHVHPRATEIYCAISGGFTAGLVQENGGTPINGTLGLGDTFVVPQGLIHYMANSECTPSVFTQAFSNIDPGLITLPAVLGGFPSNILSASGLSATAPTLGVFAIDESCKAACGSNYAAAPSAPDASAGRKLLESLLL